MRSGLASASAGRIRWVRFIFVDEAGTSDHEPITVIASLIVHADEQLLFADTAIKEALDAVPSLYREGFHFHATEVWNSKEFREGWGLTDRLALLKTMMSLPRRLGIPINVAICPRESSIGVPEDILRSKMGLSKAQYQHVLTFGQGMARADKYVRDHADPKEVATIVAEDVPEMRRHLQDAIRIIRSDPSLARPVTGVRWTKKEQELGYQTQETDQRISRIRGTIHFAAKQDEPILQLADACAFGFRRFFAQEKFGDEFCAAILGHVLDREDWATFSTSTFFSHPK